MLEWLLQEIIFFDGVDVCMEYEVILVVDVVYLGVEIFCFGCIVLGEIFNIGVVSQCISICCGGKLVWFEQGCLQVEVGVM